MADQIRVTGLKELRSELRQVDTKLPKLLQKANKKVAELVAEETRSNLSSMGGSAVKVVPTVKALAQQMRAQVKAGGKGASIGELVAGGNLFGSKRYKQFPPPGVYGIYKALADKNEEIVEAYADALEDMLAPIFPD